MLPGKYDPKRYIYQYIEPIREITIVESISAS